MYENYFLMYDINLARVLHDKFKILMGLKCIRNASRRILKYENKFYTKIIWAYYDIIDNGNSISNKRVNNDLTR